MALPSLVSLLWDGFLIWRYHGDSRSTCSAQHAGGWQRWTASHLWKRFIHSMLWRRRLINLSFDFRHAPQHQTSFTSPWLGHVWHSLCSVPRVPSIHLPNSSVALGSQRSAQSCSLTLSPDRRTGEHKGGRKRCCLKAALPSKLPGLDFKIKEDVLLFF